MAQNVNVFKPTPAQEAAINAEGGAVIVSAAAGSGKTRVLVQRVIRLLTAEHPLEADRLLMLTFTNAAADEMKSRISREIYKLIEENPENAFYRRQQLLLAGADICTIDSFCGKAVRESFYRLGISHDFRISGAGESEEISRRILSEMIEEYYKTPERGELSDDEYAALCRRHETFQLLAMLLTGTKLDSGLEDELLEAYRKYISHSFPQQWIQNAINAYDPAVSCDENKAACYLAECIRPLVKSMRAQLDTARLLRQDIIDEGEVLTKKKPLKKYTVPLEAMDYFENIMLRLEEIFSSPAPGLGSIAEAVRDFEKPRLSRRKDDSPELARATAALIDFSEIVIKEIMPLAAYTGEAYTKGNERLFPVIKLLNEFLREFDEKFFAAKCEHNILDFSDLERLMISMLYEPDENGEMKTTSFAAEMAAKYDVIMVDEYQDTNEIQESIFKAISRNGENLYVVGDVKQSIYRFRDAKPSIFRERCSSAIKYNEEQKLFPALILLDRNFRSRRGIIDSVNYIFSLLMSEESGDIEYNEDHRLDFGADYPERDEPETELHVYSYGGADGEGSEENDRDTAEAAYCAELIKRAVEEEKWTVTENGQLRQVKYGDFCILMRAVSGNAQTYATQLHLAGIPACTAADSDLLGHYEVLAAVSYLKILNNPLSDIDLAASLLCPVFGFSPDELAVLRLTKGKRRSLYKRLRLAEEEELGSELYSKVQSFLGLYDELRTLAVTMPSDKLTALFFERTGFISVMGAMPDGAARVRNLRRLLSFIGSYEASTGSGLCGLVRHISYLEENGKGITVKDGQSADAVRIMTIHRSKGLEFPICILAGTGRKSPSDRRRARYHSELGIGLRDMDPERLVRFPTMQFKAIDAACSNEEKSEQLRVLYVALTRAREKLIMLTGVPVSGESSEEKELSRRKYLRGIASKIEYDSTTGHLSPRSVRGCTTYAQWLLMCAMLSGDMKELRNEACIFSPGEEPEDSMPFDEVELPALECGSRWKYLNGTAKKSAAQASQPQTQTPVSDPELMKLLRERFASEHTDITTLIASKVSASMLAHKGSTLEFAAAAKPAFARSAGVSPTERGTATHMFLQYADFGSLMNGSGNAERERIVSQGMMSPEQAELVSDESIRAFAESSICKRAVQAVSCLREYRFTVKLPASVIIENDPLLSDVENRDMISAKGAETILQGAVDLIIEEDDGIVIVDYKTDHVKDPSELLSSYGVQLRLYREAVSQLFDKPVSECIIYSLYMGKEIRTE